MMMIHQRHLTWLITVRSKPYQFNSVLIVLVADTIDVMVERE